MPKESTFLVELDGDDFVVGSLRLKAGHTPSASQRVITESEHTQVRSGTEGLHVVKSNYKLPRWKHTGTLQDQTNKVLASLTPREEQVLRMRFGIGEKTDHTLEEVGNRFAVTRERIRQIEAKALRKLRLPSRSKKLRGFLG